MEYEDCRMSSPSRFFAQFSFVARTTFASTSSIYISDIASVASVKGGFAAPLFFSRSFLASCCGIARSSGFPQQFLQHSHALVHVLLLKQKWREKSQNSILGTVEENTLALRLLHDGSR